MSRVQLTPVERRLLANQAKILAFLCPEQRKDHERTIKILEEGYEYHYDDLFTGFDEAVSESECIFVIEVLGMYHDLLLSDPSDAVVSESDKRFPGFDGNNEGALLSYTRFVMSDQSKFRELQRADYNSHMSVSQRYRDMLSRYDRNQYGRQTPEAIRALLNK